MTRGLFDIENIIIKDEAPLTEAFIPERLLHREGERDYIAGCLKPVVIGQSPRNIFIYGPPGTGKTSLVKWIFSELEAHTSNAATAYINCWKSQTTHAVLFEIIGKLAKFTNPRRQTKELFGDIESAIRRSGKKLVICLDEADKLESFDILYDFSRAGYGLVLISNNEFALVNLDERIRSSMSVEPVEFPKYSASELFDILEDRVAYALLPSKIAPELLKVASAASGGDARIALEAIRKASKLAESRGKDKIEKDELLEALKLAKKLKAEQMLSELNSHERLLYRVVEKLGTATSSEVFEEYKKCVTETAASERSLRYYMENLAASGLISAQGDVRWRKYGVKV